MTGRSTLVVGASGFLGRHIAAALIERGDSVWGTAYRNPAGLPEGCQLAEVDNLDGLQRIDRLVLCAGNHALPYKTLVALNVVLSQRLLIRFPHARVLFVSSVAVYGHHKEPIREDSSFVDPGNYGFAKLAGEAVVKAHPDHVVVRPTYLYGSGMPRNSFLPIIADHASRRGRIALRGDGGRLQDYLHVKDAAELCAEALSSGENGPFLAATGRSLANREVAALIQRRVPGCTVEYAGTDNADQFQFNNERTKVRLGWVPARSLESSIGEVLE